MKSEIDKLIFSKDLLPAAEDCYKALRELSLLCFNTWDGQKIVNRVRNYIDVLEKELLIEKSNKNMEIKEWDDYKETISFKNYCRSRDC